MLSPINCVRFISFASFVFLCCSCCSSNKAIISPNNALESFLEAKNKHAIVFAVYGDVDLQGRSITLPASAVLDIRHGSIRNGTLILNNTEIKCKDTRGLNCSLLGNCSNSYLNVNNRLYGAAQVETLGRNAVCALMSDLTISRPLAVRCSIRGVGRPIIKSRSSSVLLNILSSSIMLQNLELVIDEDTEDAKCYAIRATDVGDIRLTNLIVNGGSVYFRNNSDISFKNYEISYCTFNINHSRCNQSFEKQNDAFEFRGIQNVSFHHNTVNTTNVTRVFKTPSGGASKTPCDYLSFYDNVIKSNSINGKQVFDFYDRTRNLTVKNNVIVAKGHTDIFENKTTGDEFGFTIIIEGNTVEYGYTLLYFNLSKESNNTLILRDNKFVSTSISKNRTSIQQDTTVTARRLYDLNMRNLNNVLIEDNTFSSSGYVDGRLMYFEDINRVTLDSNSILGCWKYLAWFNKTINDVVINDNLESDFSKTSSEPVVVLSSASINSFKSYRNEFKGRGGAHFMLQNNSVIKRADIKDGGDLKQNSPFLIKGQSKIIDKSLLR